MQVEVVKERLRKICARRHTDIRVLLDEVRAVFPASMREWRGGNKKYSTHASFTVFDKDGCVLKEGATGWMDFRSKALAQYACADKLVGQLSRAVGYPVSQDSLDMVRVRYASLVCRFSSRPDGARTVTTSVCGEMHDLFVMVPKGPVEVSLSSEHTARIYLFVAVPAT